MWERFSHYGMRALLVLFLVTEASKGGWAGAGPMPRTFTALTPASPTSRPSSAATSLTGCSVPGARCYSAVSSSRPATSPSFWTPCRALRRPRSRHPSAPASSAQHLGHRRPALQQGRLRLPRRRLHAVLHGRECGRLLRHLAVRLHRREVVLEPRLRARRRVHDPRALQFYFSRELFGSIGDRSTATAPSPRQTLTTLRPT